MLNEMEKRIHDLKLSREIAIQTLPRKFVLFKVMIRFLPIKFKQVYYYNTYMEKPDSSYDIVKQAKNSVGNSKKVTDTTENLLRQNAELIKTNTIEIAKESERGVISLETLKETHKKLIETIEESMKIYQEGKQKRNAVGKRINPA